LFPPETGLSRISKLIPTVHQKNGPLSKTLHEIQRYTSVTLIGPAETDVLRENQSEIFKHAEKDRVTNHQLFNSINQKISRDLKNEHALKKHNFEHRHLMVSK